MDGLPLPSMCYLFETWGGEIRLNIRFKENTLPRRVNRNTKPNIFNNYQKLRKEHPVITKLSIHPINHNKKLNQNKMITVS